jgi:ubiquinone/menaquinone biosynthesis C-methylase UbiE
MRETDTQRFYDEYWPRNVPRAEITRAYVHGLLPSGRIGRALDAGCGTGVCSVALSEGADEVIALDISRGSIDTVERLRQRAGADNVRLLQGSLLSVPLADESVDLVWCWGVMHHTKEPLIALDEMIRTLRPGGSIILAVYLKTSLTPLHETIRWACLRSPGWFRRPFVRAVAALVAAVERVLRPKHSRPDNVSIAAQVEDWYFVPEKHFFSTDEMRGHFRSHGLTFELLEETTGRFRSSSNFTALGRKLPDGSGDDIKPGVAREPAGIGG